MKSNIGFNDRLLRLLAGVALLAFAWWQSSWIALLVALFIFYEVLAGWCAFYQLIGKNTCPLPEAKNAKTHPINQMNFALAGGILWGTSLLVLTLISMYTGYATKWLDLIANAYPGYDVSFKGSIVGMVYAFFDAFIGLYLFTWIYNRLSR